MRWLSVMCVLLPTVTAVLVNERAKRTVPYLRLSQQPSVADNVLLYRIPGYDDVLLKVTPKKVLSKTVAPIHMNNAVINGTPKDKSCVDESSGFQKIVDFIKTGINNKKQLLSKIFAPSPPVNPIIIIKEQTKVPVIQEIVKPSPRAIDVKYTETVEEDVQPMAVAAIADKTPKFIAKPKQVVTEVMKPTYSYKQASRDGTMMSYEFEDNPNVIVTETVAMPPLPTYIKSRFEEIASAAIVPSMMRVPGAVIREGISFGPPIIPGNFGNVITPLPPIAAPIYPPAFARLQNLGYFEGGDFYGPPILVEEDIPVLLRSTTDIFKIPGPKGDVNVKITKNKRPTSTIIKTSTDAYPSKVNIGIDINSSPNKGGISKAVSSPPSLSNIDVKQIPNFKTPPSQSQISQRSISSTEYVATDNILRTDQGSSFVYKQVSNKNMKPLDISQAAPSSNLELVNKDVKIYDVPNRMSNYYLVPPAKGNIEPPPINMQNPSISQESIQRSNQGTLRPCLDNQATKSPLCPEPYFRSNDAALNSPIVVSDSAPFVYKQINADGSSMSMMGSQNNVVVDVKGSESNQDYRGDIAQTGYYK